MPKKVCCTGCPIFTEDGVNDPFCKLGYKIFWNQKWSDEKYLSNGCSLDVVVFDGGEFRPTKREPDLKLRVGKI